MKRIITILMVMLCAATSVSAASSYTIQRGDTLWKLSLRYAIPLERIIEANRQLPNIDLVYPGDRVTIPDYNSVTSFEAQVVKLTNVERQKNGLAPLAISQPLMNTASLKAADMRDRRYFSHQSPTYGSPFDMMKKYNIAYATAAENIAAGQTTPAQVVTAWMNSPGHRANMLNRTITHIGVGYSQGGTSNHYWVQHFMKPLGG